MTARREISATNAGPPQKKPIPNKNMKLSPSAEMQKSNLSCHIYNFIRRKEFCPF